MLFTKVNIAVPSSCSSLQSAVYRAPNT